MEVNGHSLPAAESKSLENIGERIQRMDVEIGTRLQQEPGNLLPRGIFAKEQDLKDRVLHQAVRATPE